MSRTFEVRMTTLGFLPRSLQKRRAAAGGSTTHPHRGDLTILETSNPETSSGSSSQAQERSKPQISDEDLLLLLELSLSEYNIWCNVDLQRSITLEKEGYFLFKQLFRRFTPLSELSTETTESDMVRCIRNSPDTFLETRMVVKRLSRHARFGGVTLSSSWGIYEVRRKDWKDIIESMNSGLSKEWWDQRTIYIERVPAIHRSLQSVSMYIQGLLALGDQRFTRQLLRKAVQAISFPPRYLTPSYEMPQSIGFAFVVLNSQELVQTLCQICPWDGPSAVAQELDAETRKFGTRILDKRSWEELKEEYLAYQRFLLSDVPGDVSASAEIAGPEIAVPIEAEKRVDKRPLVTETLESRQQHEFNWFPRSCLVFVRNIHPETNKTTLRMLFGSRIPSGKDGVDYVDFIKGIDSCHLRLVSPDDATALVAFFSTNVIAQKDPLDQEGTRPSKGQAKIEVELLQGKREELYWERIPEKARQAALERLRCSISDPHSESTVKKAKRRRRG